MAITDIANVAISLQGVTVSRQGYGTPLFLSKHRFTKEVVTSYSNLTAVGQVFPTTSNAYKAAQQFFSNTPAGKAFKVGRIESNLVLTVDAVATGKVFSFTIKSGAASANISVTATGSDTTTTIATAIAAAVESSSVGALVAATSALGVVTIAPTAPNKFAVSSLLNLTDTYTSTATAAQALQAALDADSDVYFITSEDKSVAWVMALAEDVDARKLQYFVAVAGADNYGSYTKGAAGANDILGKLSDEGYFRSVGMYHHDAANFPELTYVGYNAPFDAGSVIWTNNVVAIAASKNVDGNVLTGTQQDNLQKRNATFIRVEGGQNATRGGRVAAGEPIDNIRGRDWLENEMKANLTQLLLSQQGTKIPYNDDGINRIRSVMAKTLDLAVRRNFINDNYRITLAAAADISAANKAAGLFNDGYFVAELSGGIELVDITGTLSVQI
jgi:hypothetical protein